jgi:hypothetical protein
VFLSYDNDDDHGIRWANMVQAVARWRRLGALHEATDTLHWSMCLMPYHPDGMVIAFAIDSLTFFYII